MVNYKFLTMLGFIMEVFCFTLTGYLMALKIYIAAGIFLIFALVFAFLTGRAIYNRGKEDVKSE